jgi:hypothetical protein
MSLYMFSVYYNNLIKQHPELRKNYTMLSNPNSPQAESLNTELLAGTITLSIITLLLYTFRMYARTFPAPKLWWDDMYISLAAVCLSSIHVFPSSLLTSHLKRSPQ